jgi:peroxiredoxin
MAGIVSSAWAGTPTEAEAIRRAYSKEMETWTLTVRAAATPDAQRAAWQSRPDAVVAAKKMWVCLKPSLAEEWTLEPAAWLLRLLPSLAEVKPDGTRAPVLTDAIEEIRKSVETRHLKSSKLAPICLGLVAVQDPRSLALLEKIVAANPDKKVRGVASLGIAMLLKGMGDEGEIMKRRLSMLRTAIIDSADVEVDGVSVAKLAESELYIIRYLSKGRVAPDLEGADSAARPMKLSDFHGKTVVLLFWGSAGETFGQVADMVKNMEKKFAGKPFAVVGVNNDTLAALRAMQADGRVTWKNFTDPENKLAQEYRVGTWPLAYVLDGERKIRFMGAPGSFVELTVEAVMSENGEKTDADLSGPAASPAPAK